MKKLDIFVLAVKKASPSRRIVDGGTITLRQKLAHKLGRVLLQRWDAQKSPEDPLDLNAAREFLEKEFPYTAYSRLTTNSSGMEFINRGTLKGFIKYFSRRQAHFQMTFGKEYSDRTAESEFYAIKELADNIKQAQIKGEHFTKFTRAERGW